MGHAFDAAMNDLSKRFRIRRKLTTSVRSNVFNVLTLIANKTPHTRQEARCTLDARFAPIDLRFRRSCKKHEEPRSISPIFSDDFVRVDDIALRLAHLHDAADIDWRARFFHHAYAITHFGFFRIEVNGVRCVVFVVREIKFFADHALREQRREWFARRAFRQVTEIDHHLLPKACVEKMHDRVFNATNVQIDRQPRTRALWINRPIFEMWRRVAIEIPARFNERVERICFATRGLCALRARDIYKCCVTRKR